MKLIVLLCLFFSTTTAVDWNTECINGIYTGLSKFNFFGQKPGDTYGNVCTNKLGVRSLWAAAKSYCTPKEIEAGEKKLGGDCTKKGNVTLVPYFDVLPILTDQFIHNLQAVQFSDIKVKRIRNNSVLLSPTLFEISRGSQATYDQQHELHFKYGWALYGFWGGLLLIGIMNRLLSHLFHKRLVRARSDIESNESTRSAHVPTFPPFRFLTLVHHWLRANLIIAAAFGSHHRRSLWWATVPTRMEALVVSAFWALNIILCCVSYEFFYPNLFYPIQEMQKWRYISDRTGIIAYANLPWLWMFAGRNNVFIWATGWTFSNFNIFHRHIARVVTIEAIAHSIGYTVVRINGHRYATEWQKNYWEMGAIATIALSFLVTSSSKYIRRKCYEAFLIAHIVFAVLTIAGLLYHTAIFDGGYGSYLWPLVAIWAFDRSVRFVRLVYCNIHCGLSKNLLTTKARVIYDEHAEVVRLEIIAGSQMPEPKPGQYYFLYRPLKWKGWENHPFTLAGWSRVSASDDRIPEAMPIDSPTSDSSTTAKEKDIESTPLESTSSTSSAEERANYREHDDHRPYKLVFCLRVFAGWTRRLSSECLQSPTGTITTGNFLIEGPYGETAPLNTYDYVVLIAGGTGITAVLPYLQDHLARTAILSAPSSPSQGGKKAHSTCTRKIALIWSFKHPCFIRDVAARELRPCLDREDVAVRLCATARDESPSGIAATTEKPGENAETTQVSGSTLGKVEISWGRPDVYATVTDFIDAAAAGAGARRVAVFACGPAGMMDDAREAVRRALKQGKTGVGYFEEFRGKAYKKLVEDPAWPPISAREALLSSPSGRKKYEDALGRRQQQQLSPMKKSATTSSLTTNSRRLLDEDEDPSGDVEDEDEETLKLQLAAIEAKLKLKKLQQNRSRSQANSSDAENQEWARPKSVGRSRPPSGLPSGRDLQGRPEVHPSKVEVPLSPTKRNIPQTEAKSPSRILLGIDKGARAGDVSLRRAPSGRESRFQSDRNTRDGRESRFDSFRSRSTTSSENSTLPRVKTFSERMADIRSDDTARQNRRERLQINRSTSFKLNAQEMHGYRAAAEEINSRNRSRSPVKRREAHDYERDEVLKSYRNRASSSGLQRDQSLSHTESREASVSRPSDRRSPSPLKSRRDHTMSSTPRSSSPFTDPNTREATDHYDSFSESNLSARILPHTILTQTFSSIAPIRLPYLLKHVKAPDFELPENTAGDFAVLGIIASTSKPYEHKDRKSTINHSDAAKSEQKWEDGRSAANSNDNAGRKFMVLTLTDLKWTVDLFLFNTALPRYHRLSPGTVIAVLNPGIMPPKSGKIDTGAFSLTLHSGDDTILEIGRSQDLGFCKSLRKDGRECGSWVDTRKTEFCDFHVDLKVQKTQAGRMGVNTGSNAFGPGGGRFGNLGDRRGQGRWRNSEDETSRARGRSTSAAAGAQNGAQRDLMTGERYFISTAPSSSRPPTATSSARPRSAASASAAAIIDAELNDDPFLAEGVISRDTVSRSDRMRKRLASQAREREIARKLGEGVVSGASSTGAEYLRHRDNGDDGAAQQARNRAERRMETRGEILGLKGGGGARRENKRNVEDVSLSPVRGGAGGGKAARKKTRFVTEKGIREAGRESLGAAAAAAGDGMGRDGGIDDEDDFLDII